MYIFFMSFFAIAIKKWKTFLIEWKKDILLYPVRNLTFLIEILMFYGVMVTRQILVLKFQVRALVEQHSN